MSAPEEARTLAEVERIVLASGMCGEVVGPEFSADGVSWLPYFIASEAAAVPLLGRASVRRYDDERDSSHLVSVVVVWGEAVPVEDEWLAKWRARPSALFGARVLRTLYRRAFRDIVDVVANPDEGDDPREHQSTAAPGDWAAEIAAAADEPTLTAVVGRMTKARQSTPVLDRAWRARRDALRAPAPAPSIADHEAAVDEAAASRPTPATVFGTRQKAARS